MNASGDSRDTHRGSAAGTIPGAGKAALCLQADQVMTQVAAALREARPADAAHGLTELAGALALAGEQGLAALVERLRHAAAAAGALDTDEGADLPDRALRLRAELRHGLERSLRGRSPTAADLLPAWRALAGTGAARAIHGAGDADDVAALLSLQVDQRFELELPDAGAGPVSAEPLADAERALLGLLRATDTIGRREAAGSFAHVLAGVAAATGQLAMRRLWLVLHACANELAAGNGADAARMKPILAQSLRALRHRADPCLPAMLAPVARQALFELAQSPPSTAAARQAVRAFRLPQQLSRSTDGDAAAGPEPLDAADEHFTSALERWIAARETLADGLGPVAEWHALAEAARSSGRCAPLAGALERLVEPADGAGAQDIGECVAAAMLCLHSWAMATAGAGMDAFRMAGLLELAAADPSAAKPALQAMARRLSAQPLMVALAAACSDVMESGERLLDEAAIEHDAVQATADVRRLLEAMAGAARLLALDSVLPLAETLLDPLQALRIASPDDPDGAPQAFALGWVALADEIAMLPWTAGWPGDPAPDLPRQERQDPPLAQAEPLPQQAAGDAALADPLSAIFLEEAAGLLAQLRAALLPLAAEAPAVTPPVTPADALHAAHTLAGCAVTVGLPAMGRLAHALEALLEVGEPLPSPLADPATVREVLDALEAMMAAFAETGACRDADALAARLRANLPLAGMANAEWQPPLPVLTGAGLPSSSPAAEGRVGILPDEVEEEGLLATAGSPLTDEAIAAAGLAADVAAGSDVDSHADSDAGGLAAVDATRPPVVAQDDELLAIFREEAADLLPQLEQALHAWQQSPDDRAAATPLLRILHTLKGSARMAGQLAWGDALHCCESEVGAIAQLAPAAIVERLAALQVRIDEWQNACCGSPDSLPGSLSGSLPGASPDATSASILDPAEGVAAFDAVDAADPADGAAASGTARLEAPASLSATSPSVPQAAARGSSSALLRVRADRFTTFADAVAELWVGHARLADGVQQQRRAIAELADTLARLRAQVRELEIDAESRIVSVAAPSDDKGFDPLEFDRYTRLHEITRMIAESAADLGDLQRSLMRQGDGLARAADAQVRELRGLQSSLQAVRSQPFGAIEARLRQVIRQAARESGREVECVVAGASVEVDRSLLDRLAGPLEHVLRNAVVHGIEPPAERAALGKPRAGRISVGVAASAAELRLELADDGGGLDLERIRDRASAIGLLAAQADPGPHALSDLIFQPGFSTASEVTALAGRGIGLDAVRSELHALGGRIAVDSRAGQGCCFTICVPLSLATLPVLLVRAGRHRIGLPAPRLQQLLQLKPGDPGHAAGSRTLPWEGAEVPLADLGQLLGEPPQPARPDARVPVAVVGESGRLLALRLDAVEGQRELVVKSPGPQLSRVPGLAGASVLGDGSIALIVDPFRLDAGGKAVDRALPAPIIPAAGPLVLVVDDSLTVRRASQRLLERHGYEVALARDGIEALAQLRQRRPAAVLLDIEMPRMDGFELLAALRDDPQLRELAVVMITSRIADRHRQRAQQLGASAYMGKPFREEELVSLLAGLCGSTAGEQHEGRMEKQSRSERPEAAA